eukprot:GFYU01003278.1.p1 GENE.GFYU01003278.1~~GFYU01003278.1.p1  ORF type:complete len:169 (-),score=47.85 GFYU01003278.1:104-610(-)
MSLANVVKYAGYVPEKYRSTALTAIASFAIKYVGTSGARIVELTHSKAEVTLQNRKRVQNHIGGVHACAMALTAETATGFVLGMNVPADRMPLLKTMSIDYNKRAKGNIRAVAELTPEMQQLIRNTEKGELTVPVVVTDEEGKEPIEASMTWAWIPKVRKPKAEKKIE